MPLLRAAWLCVCCYLSLNALVQLLPIPFCPGGLIKITAANNAGPFFAVHLAALIAYAAAYAAKVCGKQTLKLPAIVSAAAATGLLLPLLASAPALIALPQSLIAAFGPLPPELLPLAPPPFSFRRWLSPSSGCAWENTWPHLPNVSRTFRHYRPASAPPPKPSPAYPFTQAFFDALFLNQTAAQRRPGRLELLLFPPPPSAGSGGGCSSGGGGGWGSVCGCCGGGRGLVVFIHGGGFWVGQRESSFFGCHLRHAHAHGWAAATIEYRLAADGWDLSHMVSDVIAGIEVARSRCRSIGVDPFRLVLIGSSAGGYLALQAAYIINKRARGRRVAAVVSLSAATDLGISRRQPVSLGAWDEARMASTLCGDGEDGDGRDGRDARSGCKPVSSLVSAYSPPTLLLHTRDDMYFGIEHARSLATALAAAAVPHVLLELPVYPHGAEGGGAVAQHVGYALSHILLALGK